MSIILLILKITGIIILSVIGLLLAVILLVLFCPLSYKIKGQYLTDEDPYFHMRVTWFFRVISIVASYENEFVVKIKVLFFTIYTNKKKTKISKVSKNASADNKRFDDSDMKMEGFEDGDSFDDLENNSNLSVVNDEEFVVDDYFNYYEEAQNPNEDSILLNDNGIDESYVENIANNVNDEESKDDAEGISGLHNVEETNIKKRAFVIRLFDKIIKDVKLIYKKIKEEILLVIDIIKGFINNACILAEDTNAKINKLKSDIDNINAIIKDEKNIEYVKLVISEVKHLLKSILPHKISGFLNYGFDDPSYTGKTCGYVSIVRPYIKKEFKINPYFNKKIFEISCDMKGHIFLCVVFNVIRKIYFNKDRKRLFNMLNKEE